MITLALFAALDIRLSETVESEKMGGCLVPYCVVRCLGAADVAEVPAAIR